MLWRFVFPRRQCALRPRKQTAWRKLAKNISGSFSARRDNETIYDYSRASKRYGRECKSSRQRSFSLGGRWRRRDFGVEGEMAFSAGGFRCCLSSSRGWLLLGTSDIATGRGRGWDSNLDAATAAVTSSYVVSRTERVYKFLGKQEIKHGERAVVVMPKGCTDIVSFGITYSCALLRTWKKVFSNKVVH